MCVLFYAAPNIAVSLITGTIQVFTKAELEVVAELCNRYDVICVMDEVYEWLIYSGSQHFRFGET